MRRVFKMLVVLFLLYLILQILFNKFGKGHEISYSYSIGDQVVDVKETYIANRKDENNNYYLELTIGNKLFNFETYFNANGAERIVKAVKYVDGSSYVCMLPAFQGKNINSYRFLFDLTCQKDGIQYPYHAIIGKDTMIDNFVATLDDFGYDTNQWADDILNEGDAVIDKTVTVYKNQIVEGHYVGLNNYRGIYTVNKANLRSIMDIDIFPYDVYNRPLSAMIDNYYITADYGQRYSFDQFYLIDLVKNSEQSISVGNRIDFDAYIQGVVDGSLYLFDRENKIQYQITTSPLGIVKVGDEASKVKYYNNGVWTRISAFEAAKKDYIFNTDSTSSDATYTRIDKVGNLLSGYYYYYKKVGSSYEVYRAYIQNLNIKNYLFTTNKIGDIEYVDDFIYYSSGNQIKYYSDVTGEKTLLKNSEFDFNSNLYFKVYKK